MIDLGSLLILISLLILVGVYISRPLLERRGTTVSEEEQTFSALMAERDRLLDAIQELDFDHSVGKVPPEDYPQQRSSLLQRGAEVLRQLDTYLDQPISPSVGTSHEAALAGLVAENQDAEQRQPMAASTTANILPDDEIEDLITTRRRELNGKAVGFCPHCGHPIQRTDQFCSKCGATVVL